MPLFQLSDKLAVFTKPGTRELRSNDPACWSILKEAKAGQKAHKDISDDEHILEEALLNSEFTSTSVFTSPNRHRLIHAFMQLAIDNNIDNMNSAVLRITRYTQISGRLLFFGRKSVKSCARCSYPEGPRYFFHFCLLQVQ